MREMLDIQIKQRDSLKLQLEEINQRVKEKEAELDELRKAALRIDSGIKLFDELIEEDMKGDKE